MPSSLITGLPGAGKTLRMMQRLKREAEEQAKAAAAGQPTRPLVCIGIDGLEDGPWIVMDDGARWADAPDNSLIFVDEAWKWFGHLQDTRGKPTPPHVLALAEHRHRGIDFVWTSQAPSQIYPFARALIGEHEHVVRKFGTPMCDVYRWGELQEDVKSQAVRDRALTEQWLHPPALYNTYKSATIHTIKPKLPLRVFLVPVCFVVGLVLVYFAWQAVKSIGARQEESTAALVAPAGAVPQGGEAAAAGPASTAKGPAPAYTTAEEYFASFTPVVPGMPWTAPAYRNTPTMEPPELACMSSVDSCTCITIQQGTRWTVGDDTCRHIAVHGVWNPTKRASYGAAASKSDKPAQDREQPREEAPRVVGIRNPQPRVGEPYRPPEG